MRHSRVVEIDQLSDRVYTSLQLNARPKVEVSSGDLPSRLLSIRRKPVLATPTAIVSSVSLQPPPTVGQHLGSTIVTVANEEPCLLTRLDNACRDESDQCVTFPDASTFRGQLTLAGMPAHGKITYPTGNFYTGPFEDGVPCGLGKLRIIDAHDQLKGEFKGDFIAGMPFHGIFQADSGYVYKGSVTPKCLAKRGIKTDPDGTVSEGMWLVDERDEGSFDGMIRHGDGSTFEGSIRLFAKVKGTTRWPGGDSFVGTYGKDARLSCGTYSYSDGVTLDATWNDDGNPIEGKQTLPSGEVFIGTFLNFRKLNGTLSFVNGNIFKGKFIADGTGVGKCRAKGVMTYANGSSFSGDFIDDHVSNGIGRWQKSGKQYAYEGLFDTQGQPKRDLDGALAGTMYTNGIRSEGTNTTKDGAVFKGSFHSDGTRNSGVAKFRDGSSYKGLFVNNLMANGSYTWPNGNTFTGLFRNGKISDGRMVFAETDSVYLGTFFRDDDPLDGNLTTTAGIVWKYRGGKRKRNRQVEAMEKQQAQKTLSENSGRAGGGTADRIRGEINNATNTAVFWRLYNNS